MTSSIGEWLEAHLSSLPLSEDCEGYLLGRGASPDTIERLGIREWEPASTPAPSEHFTSRYGRHGEKLAEMVTIPLRGPTGTLLGIEARSRFEKKVTEFRVPESQWNTVILNAPRAAEAMWSGGSVWVVEGVYDLCALDWCIPKTDAVIATLRAGLSKDAVEFLARFCTNTVYMVYDNDETGRKATHGWKDPATGKYRPGALDLLTRAGVRAVDYRYRGKDPGEVWRAGGLPALRAAFVCL
jgi:hypothetical protein